MDTDPDFTHCAQCVREGDYAKYIASLYLPVPIRQAAICLYAFDLEISKINQLVSEPMIGEIRIQWWRDVLAGKNSPAGNPVAQALMKCVEVWQLPIAILDRYLGSRIFDLYNDPMPHKHALETYLGETRASIFRLLTLCSDQSKQDETTISDACGHAGVAYGVVNLVQCLASDIANQRNFIPAQLSSFDQLSQAKPTAVINDDWLNDVRFFADRHHTLAQTSIEKLDPVMQSIFLPSSLANAQLAKMKASEISLKHVLPQPSKVWVHWRLWRAAKAIKPPKAN